MSGAEAPENWLSALGVIGSGAVIGVALWVRSYVFGRNETGELDGKHVILEHAELANLDALKIQLNTIGPKLETAIAQDEVRRALISRVGENIGDELGELKEQMREALTMLRRLDRELDVAQRIREDKILRDKARDLGSG